jgi:hypothetical protein
MPPSLKSQVADLLASSAVTADELDRAADQTEAAGYPAEAAQLRAKARGLRAAAPMPVTMTIQSGHIPSAIAKYYTGDALRWKELYVVNPDLGAPTAMGFPNWRVGKSITIPATWNPSGKPLPRPFSTPLRPASPTPATPAPETTPAPSYEEIPKNPSYPWA